MKDLLLVSYETVIKIYWFSMGLSVWWLSPCAVVCHFPRETCGKNPWSKVPWLYLFPLQCESAQPRHHGRLDWTCALCAYKVLSVCCSFTPAQCQGEWCSTFSLCRAAEPTQSLDGGASIWVSALWHFLSMPPWKTGKSTQLVQIYHHHHHHPCL